MVLDSIKNYFITHYKSSPLLIKAPGRVNLIGEHTDYNMGFVLPASIEKSIYFAFQKNNHKTINVETIFTDPEKITFYIQGGCEPFKAGWGNYFKAIIQILLKKGYDLHGFDCVFGGDIPIGAGLSSSAALCCGFIHGVSQLLDLSISKKENAHIAQEAEHLIGLNCGLMDQYAVLFGKQSHALFLDCRDLTHKYVPINLKEYSWILIDSKIQHNLAVDSEYNHRRNSCERVVSIVNDRIERVSSLRDVTTEHLERIKLEVNPEDYKRAKYVLEENDRVHKMMDALELGNADLVGQILLQGHWAMSKDYEITTPELDYLVKTGEQLEDVKGSRMMGGGFGGCTINLIKTDNLENSLEIIRRKYKEETSIECETYQLEIGDGVHIL
ncbi:galactokinase [Maribacter cobaltidurans]|uniref:Galactokinase n=1 Tax=Maribacter cobaltidurans TaxID=1178778 RepID=A0A223VAJ0_9FLAO|nr:galactokinase [Maribacter cobaltidurans]ASV32307.1 galactokinase [Maribacter cobaltidurans]GGD94791.1 galactokinase [Maribacter cobaltidurans]